MDSGFVFEPPSDEERDDSPSEEEEIDEEEEEDDYKPSNKPKQSPWDFASFSESVAEEHNRRSTTSIDQKIAKVLQQHSIPLTNTADEDDSDVESDRQVFFPPL